MKVEDLMVSDVKTCTIEDTVNRAAQLMWEHDCGCLIVLTPGNRVAGTITDRDVCMAAYTQGLTLNSIDVADVMSTEVVSCAPLDDALRVAARMRANRIRRLPVIDSTGALVGMVSLNGLARRAVLERGRTANGLSPEAVLETLAAVCRPRGSDGKFAAWAPPEARKCEPRAQVMQHSG